MCRGGVTILTPPGEITPYSTMLKCRVRMSLIDSNQKSLLNALAVICLVHIHQNSWFEAKQQIESLPVCHWCYKQLFCFSFWISFQILQDQDLIEGERKTGDGRNVKQFICSEWNGKLSFRAEKMTVRVMLTQSLMKMRRRKINLSISEGNFRHRKWMRYSERFFFSNFKKFLIF